MRTLLSLLVPAHRSLVSVVVCSRLPKGAEKQWKDGRSAKELARAWCPTSAPALSVEMIDTLNSHRDTAGFVAGEAIPELVTPLDAEKGEARNHDLAVVGVAAGVGVLVAVEVKAGEPFGDKTVAQCLPAGAMTPRSGVPRRIAGLVEAIMANGRISLPVTGFLSASPIVATNCSPRRRARSLKRADDIVRESCCWYTSSLQPRHRRNMQGIPFTLAPIWTRSWAS